MREQKPIVVVARDAGTRLQETKQHLSPPSPGDPSLWGGMAGLVVKGTPKPTESTTSPMSSYDAPTSAKIVTEAEKDREGDAARAQMTSASQPRKRRKTRKVMKTKTYCCVYPGRSTFEDCGSCTARGACAGTVDPFDTAGMLGNLWRRMQLRR